MKPRTLQDYYVEELKDLFDAEKQLLKALPRMARAATHEDLRSALEEHAEVTQEQANRLEKILQNHGQKGRGRRCKAMMGLIEEGQDMMAEKPGPDVMDVSLLTTAQKVEHYEIAGYGCVATYAKILGHRDEAELLHQTLTEEKEADQKLTRLAKSVVNPEAASGEEEEEDEPMARRGGRSGARGARSGMTHRSTGRSMTPSSSRSHARSSTPSRGPTKTRASGRSNSRRGAGSHNSGEGEAKHTKDLEEIRAWAEARGGKPAHVCGTGKGEDPGMLRIDFPGYSGADSLEAISWEEWYEKFKDNNLTFLYQDKTKDGRESRFFKLVCMEGASRK